MIPRAQLYDRLSSLVDLGPLRRRKPRAGRSADPMARLFEATRALPTMRSETRALSTAAEVLDGYAGLDPAQRLAFFRHLRDGFDPDPDRLAAAARAYAETRDPDALARLTRLSEPPRQELLRRLNATPGGTARLVGLRADLLAAMRAGEDLGRVDADLRHLFRSWFNRGFLSLERIDWTSPAILLEKLIAYEAVHTIHGFSDLRRRVVPEDRRCYAYLHPAMPSEPLIFVEIALLDGLPGSVQALIAEDAAPLAANAADTAVFYSISNCQEGLSGISFGNLLIKNVVAELRRDLPNLTRFVTLSPIPGLRRWLEGEAAAGSGPAAAALADGSGPEALAEAARYLLTARDDRGRPLDPVARFHLGNGAEAQRLIAGADSSPKGRAQSLGIMVSYHYDLGRIDARHDDYTERGVIAAALMIHALARRTGRDEKETRP